MSGEDSGDQDDKLLRQFEREVLDTYHEGLALWQLPRPEAIYSVLAAYDSMVVVMREIEARKASFTHLGPYQYLKAIDEGFCEGLRWVTRGRGVEAVQPTASGAAIDAGGAFLVHAASYAQVAHYHVLYSRGVVRARVDQDKRTVRFEPRNIDRPTWETFAERSTIYEHRRRPSDEMHIALNDFVARLPYDLHSGRISIRDPMRVLAPEVEAFARIALPRVTLPLGPEADLGGFSMGAFRAFWFALYCWSQALGVLFLNRVYVKRAKQESGMPTQVMPLSEFIGWMAEMSRLERRVVARIVDRLSYDPTSPKADPFLTPLLRAGDDVCWSPICIGLSRAERNILKAMARHPALGDLAATLIGTSEGPMLRDLGLLLAQRGQYSYALRKHISVGYERGEIDLLAWTNRAPGEVLVVEAKALLTTGDTTESVRGNVEMAKAQAQLVRAAQLLKDTPDTQRRQMFPFVPWERVDTYRLLILTPDSQLGHAVDESVSPVATLDALKTHVRRRWYASPSTLWEVCRSRPWLAQYATGPIRYLETKIGDVTYELPHVGELEEDEPAFEPLEF